MHRQAEPRFEEYPFERSCARMSSSELTRYMGGLHGLNRLRAIADRKVARQLFDVYVAKGWHNTDP